MPDAITTEQLLNMLTNRVYDVYCQLHQLLKKWLAENRDIAQDIRLRPYYIYIMEFSDKVEGVLQLLSSGDTEAKSKFIISKAKGVDELEGRIIQFNRRNQSGPHSSSS
jgi:hypothetical protein